MNIHEYQAKGILKKYGVAVQRGIVADTPDKALDAAKELQAETGTKWFVVKSQIHAGGRGKGTVKETGSKGVVLAKGIHEVSDKAKAILGGTLVTIQTGPTGKKVNKVLIAEDVYYPGESEPKEYY
ncbi:MAG: ATP-grasp domain-containing protein, partial [Cyclobacteriaceae bacterium]